MHWKRHRLYIPTSAWSGTPPTQTQVLGPVYGKSLAAAGATTVEGALKIPTSWDPTFNLGFRLNFTEGGATGTAVTAVTWTMLADIIKANAITLANAATALDTVLTATTLPATPKSKSIWTGRGIKNGPIGVPTDIDDGMWLQWSAALTTAANIDASNTIVLLGVEIDYVPMLTQAPHSELDRPLASDYSGV